MKRNFCKVISVLMMLVMLFSTGIAAISSSAASESSYTATFSIKTDKASVKSGENVTVSLKLKTNYYIYAMQVPVMYDADAFTMQNTGGSTKSFLTFHGQMATAYRTDGNWKSPEDFYKRRNSNTAYWSQKSVMDKYKIAYATWAADSTLNGGKAVKLSSEETIISFVLKAKKDISNFDGLIFISKDFMKTSNFAGGLWFCGRSGTEKIDVNNYVAVGQTLKFSGSVPKHEEVKNEEGAVVINYKSTKSLKNELDSKVINGYKLKWTSADESIVTVDADGNIYGAKAGETTVTVKSTDGKFTETFNVQVSYSFFQWFIIIVLFGWIWYV